MRRTSIFAMALLTIAVKPSPAEGNLNPIAYNNPGLVVDLGVGLWAWPLPMDYDGDGDNDLVVTCPDTPTAATLFFENAEGDVKLPVFKPGVRIAGAERNPQISYVDGEPHVLTPGMEYGAFRSDGFGSPRPLPLDPKLELTGHFRANQWRWCDYDGDRIQDIVVGIGDWTDYGWDNAYDAKGNWTHGPLHGWVYFARNTGSIDAPVFAEPMKLEAGGKSIDVFGMPSPNFADFDGDGDLDLICGEFLDGFTWFENTGTRTAPAFAAGKRLTYEGNPVRMDLEMIVPQAFDWDKDGDLDLIVGDEDGRVALIENTGDAVDRMPQFKPPVYFQQQAAYVKCGALVTPFSFDWDADGDDDLLCGSSAGYISFIENLGGAAPRWAAPKHLDADGKIIRIQAGSNGSIQGPAEAKWGYTTLSVADWDGDKLPDLVVNSIWGKVIWFRNDGLSGAPKLAAARPIDVVWKGAPPKPEWNWWNPEGNELVTQWRTTPVAIDFNGDGLTDLVMLDHEGYLAYFKRVRGTDGTLQLEPGQRIFVDESGAPLNLSNGSAGKSGRRKIAIADWDGDQRLDILINSSNCDWMRNLRNDGEKLVFRPMGAVSKKVLAGHSTSPTVADWNHDGVPELLLGAEDGRIYRLNR